MFCYSLNFNISSCRLILLIFFFCFHKILIQDKTVTCRVLEGEEEEKYLTKAKTQIVNTRQKYNKGKKGKKGQYNKIMLNNNFKIKIVLSL